MNRKIQMGWNLREIGRWVAMVFMTLWFVACGSQQVRADERALVVRDSTGEEVLEEPNGYYETLNEVFFCLNEQELQEGEIFVYSSSVDCGERFGPINPMEDNVLCCAPDESMQDYIYMVRFYCFEEETGKMRSLSDIEKTYQIDFCPAGANSLRVEFVYDESIEIGDMRYIRGEAPKLYICPSKVGQTVLVHKTSDKEITYRLGDEDMTLTLAEGVHELQLYVELSDGSILQAENLPKQVCYDCTSPSDPVISISMNGGHMFEDMEEYQLFGNGTVTIHADSQDLLSGIADLQIECGEKLQPPFAGDIRARAVDVAGNASAWVVCREQILLEQEAPIVEVSSYEQDGMVVFQASVQDDGSGLWRAACQYEGTMLYDEEFSRKSALLHKYQFSFQIAQEEMGYEEKQVYVTVVDNAGNESECVLVCSRKDSTAPVIRLSGCENFAVTNEDVEIQVEIEDENLDASKVKLEAVCVDEKGNTTEVIELANLRNRFTQEGGYILFISAEDSFGNKNTDMVSFTIDRKAPEILGLQKYDGKYLKSFALKNGISDMLQDDSTVTCEMFLNGEDVADTVSVTKQGKHTLRVQAMDEAGNESTASAEFIVDSVKPHIRVNQTKAEVLLQLEDAYDYLEFVEIDGNKVFVKDSAQENDRNKFSYVFSENGTYKITARASDMAGNTEKISQTITVGTVVEKSLPEENKDMEIKDAPLEKNTKLLLPIIIGIFFVMMTAIIFFVVWWRRRRTEIDTLLEV